MTNKNKTPNVPNLRFSIFQNEWKNCKMKDVLSICHGKDYKHLKKGAYPVLGTSGIFEYVDDFLCDWPCAMIGRKGASLDRPHYMDEPFWCVDTLYYSKPKMNHNPKWQYYLFQTINWMKMNESSGIPSLRSSTIEQIEINVPSCEEQLYIAQFLDKIDNLIETQIKIIEDYILLRDLISSTLFSNYHDFISLETFISKGKAGGTPKSTVKEYYNGEIPFLSISDITEQGKYINKTAKTISKKGLSNSSAWLVPKNSLILSMYASVGLPTINKIPLATSQAMYSMILKNETNIDYLYYYLLYYQKNKIHKFLETGTQSNINADTVKSIKVPKISEKEKNKISNTLKLIDGKISNEILIKDSFIKEKNYLLTNMFI